MLPLAAREFYATQQAVAEAAQTEVGRLWRRMGDNFDGSWSRIRVPVLATIVEGQHQMTTKAVDYVPRMLDQADIPDRPTGDFVPESLAGIASDGRPLASLADQAVIGAKVAVSNGATVEQALDEQGVWLQIVAQLQVADAARQAVGILTASRKNIGGHVRVLNPPSCSRCAILGGRFYRWSKGFDRHPGDDCTMAPVPSKAYAEAEGFVQSPMDAYRNGEISDLTEAQIKALDEGADISQVVNAYKGVSTTSTRTRVINRRGGMSVPTGVQPGQPDLLAFIDPGTRFRSTHVPQSGLTPEGIYAEARGNRDRAIELLREYGYLK